MSLVSTTEQLIYFLTDAWTDLAEGQKYGISCVCVCWEWWALQFLHCLNQTFRSKSEGTDGSTQLFLLKNTKHWAFNCVKSFTIQITCVKDTSSPKIGRIWQDYLQCSCFHVKHLAMQGNILYFRASQNSARALRSQ